MGVKSKLDALDLIINVLIEHEKRLDDLIQRLEKNTEIIEEIIKREKISQIIGTLKNI
jgi:hypothetical protein